MNPAIRGVPFNSNADFPTLQRLGSQGWHIGARGNRHHACLVQIRAIKGEFHRTSEWLSRPCATWVGRVPHDSHNI